MAGLTAKVFRTYNASYTFSILIRDMKPEGSVAEKVKAYNDANRKVAILCNHKRTVAASHAGQMEKIGDRVCGNLGRSVALINPATDQGLTVPKMASETNDA
jgi:DNA topoisomerase I